ncbi:MBL fold metallo-hydrolase [Halocatena pleomorpha]|uniref:MBL fold metallo-hydrolase n=1 Tax=Halocatena pleomorpha TaxID=1785090 RepID=A0A3P3RB24_9EURY|nr:MBL fold metallo-hydrolase [Halocatena pleomorpha]RRJ30138.1 MBL fold metallo-hydrolase [Halocatena pleomorpha]
MEAVRLENAEFEGENSVYLLQDDDAVALIDTGIATPETERALRAQLATHDIGFEQIDTVVLTHWHADHAGLAGTIQRESGATVYVHENDAPLVRRTEQALEDFRTRQREQFEAWGMPASERESLLSGLEVSDDLMDEPERVEPITDGDSIDVAGHRLDVLHAPGHTAGQCCFEFHADDGLAAFGGDALLPVYTPNVGGADVRVDRPLERYRNTLETIATRAFERVWPGHRGVITDPTDRARSIIDHHRERAERVCTVVADHGPATAWETSAHLFGDLEGIHVMHGPGEAYAHLDHLQRHGIVTATDDGYALNNDSVSAAAVI